MAVITKLLTALFALTVLVAFVCPPQVVAKEACSTEVTDVLACQSDVSPILMKEMNIEAQLAPAIEAEELDCPQNCPSKSRLPLIATSLPLKNPCDFAWVPMDAAKTFLPTQSIACRMLAELSSWLDRNQSYTSVLCNQPPWLRCVVLLI